MSFSNSSIMSVAELIDAAFGPPDANVVHHKYIQAVLYLLARQLRILQRRVDVNLGIEESTTPLAMAVTEVKLHAVQKKKKQLRSKSAGSGKSDETDKHDPKALKLAPKVRSGASVDKASNINISKSSTIDDFNKDRISAVNKSARSLSKITQSGKNPQEFTTMLNEFEQKREREIRLIQQRANSYESRSGIAPTPMKSLDSVEAKYEKLFVIERIPIEEAKARAASEVTGSRSLRNESTLPIVTHDEFLKLAYKVKQIQNKIGIDVDSTADLPERLQLMLDLRKGASLTDAMTALQLSARVEAMEKTMEQLVVMVTDLAVQSGIQMDHKKGMKVIYERQATNTHSNKEDFIQVMNTTPKAAPLLSTDPSKASIAYKTVVSNEEILNTVTWKEFDEALQQTRDEILETVLIDTAKSTAIADNANKMVRNLEAKINVSVNLADRIKVLESTVKTYVDRINILDTGLSSQMTNYQEELTQMQHDLEVGLADMADALANTGGDATAVAELNSHFNDLQSAIDNAIQKQNELRKIQRDFSLDIDALRIQIEVLRETKADREEVEDALRDKAGVGALNGMVSIQHFDAIRGDLEMRIAAAYNKFDGQEMIWQRVIDDLQSYIDDKADVNQVGYLRDDVNNYLETLNKKLKVVFDVIGEPKAAALTKRIQRDGNCLICSSPAVMGSEESDTMPLLPALRPSAVGAEEQKPREDGDHKKCYPGQIISNSRSRICHRWCGGSHTILPKNLTKVPPAMVITNPLHYFTQELGTDGRMYAVDDPSKIVPCLQCNMSQYEHEPKSQSTQFRQGLNQSDDDDTFSGNTSGLTPADFCPTLPSLMNTTSSMAPPFMFSDN